MCGDEKTGTHAGQHVRVRLLRVQLASVHFCKDAKQNELGRTEKLEIAVATVTTSDSRGDLGADEEADDVDEMLLVSVGGLQASMNRINPETTSTEGSIAVT